MLIRLSNEKMFDQRGCANDRPCDVLVETTARVSETVCRSVIAGFPEVRLSGIDLHMRTICTRQGRDHGVVVCVTFPETGIVANRRMPGRRVFVQRQPDDFSNKARSRYSVFGRGLGRFITDPWGTGNSRFYCTLLQTTDPRFK